MHTGYMFGIATRCNKFARIDRENRAVKRSTRRNAELQCKIARSLARVFADMPAWYSRDGLEGVRCDLQERCTRWKNHSGMCKFDLNNLPEERRRSVKPMKMTYTGATSQFAEQQEVDLRAAFGTDMFSNVLTRTLSAKDPELCAHVSKGPNDNEGLERAPLSGYARIKSNIQEGDCLQVWDPKGDYLCEVTSVGDFQFVWVRFMTNDDTQPFELNVRYEFCNFVNIDKKDGTWKEWTPSMYAAKTGLVKGVAIQAVFRDASNNEDHFWWCKNITSVVGATVKGYWVDAAGYGEFDSINLYSKTSRDNPMWKWMTVDPPFETSGKTLDDDDVEDEEEEKEEEEEVKVEVEVEADQPENQEQEQTQDNISERTEQIGERMSQQSSPALDRLAMVAEHTLASGRLSEESAAPSEPMRLVSAEDGIKSYRIVFNSKHAKLLRCGRIDKDRFAIEFTVPKEFTSSKSPNVAGASQSSAVCNEDEMRYEAGVTLFTVASSD